MLIGLCGASGAGKSTVASYFREAGYRIIDCDALVHTLDTSADYMEKLRFAFGKDCVENGRVNRGRLGSIVFADGEKLKALNRIIAPFVTDLVTKELEKALRENVPCVLDAPLLFEYDLHLKCDLTLGVTSPAEAAVKRLMLRDGKSEEELTSRRSFQHDNSYYTEHCDCVIENDGTEEELKELFLHALPKMERMARRKRRGKKKTLPLVILGILIALCGIALLFNGKREHIRQMLDMKRYPREYRETVEDAAFRYDLEPNLLYAMMKAESGFCETAVSGAGAIGLLQVMPKTYTEDICHAVGLPPSPDTLFSPKENIEAGAYYFSKWFHYFGTYPEALASYNAGVGNVERWLADRRYATDKGLIPEAIPFSETRAYVERVLFYKEQYDTLYGRTLLPERERFPEGACYRLALYYGREYHLDPRFILAVCKTESSFLKAAVSPSGAVGIMQIMRPTYEGDIQAALSLDESFDDLFDAELNIRCGAYYLYWLSGIFHEYPEIAAAYNGGIGNVRRWLADPAYSLDGRTLIRDAIPSAQTKRYVEKVMTNYKEYCVRYPDEDAGGII